MQVRKLISVSKAVATAIVILGIIHDVATFTPLIGEGLECLDKENMNAMTYMSLMCGTSLILSGLLLISLLKKWRQHRFLNYPILLTSCFVFLNSILALIYMLFNPFAWITFILGATMFFMTNILKKKIY